MVNQMINSSLLIINSFLSIKKGELIISGSKFGVSEVRESVFASRMALTVHKFDKSDIGKYRCIAKNSLGEVEGRIHVYGINWHLDFNPQRNLII